MNKLCIRCLCAVHLSIVWKAFLMHSVLALQNLSNLLGGSWCGYYNSVFGVSQSFWPQYALLTLHGSWYMQIQTCEDPSLCFLIISGAHTFLLGSSDSSWCTVLWSNGSIYGITVLRYAICKQIKCVPQSITHERKDLATKSEFWVLKNPQHISGFSWSNDLL